MPNTPAASANWFCQGGQDYARFRPSYPPALADYLAAQTQQHQLALDVGCGSGQFTHLLAPHFDAVLGIDPSAEQIAHSHAAPPVRFEHAQAEQLPLPAGSANLITAAQAAHWFDLPAFYQEVRRVAAPNACLALISYGVLQLDADLSPLFQHFYHTEIGPYWPAERRLVDSGYATLDFPFREQTAPNMAIEAAWDLAGFLGYIGTWSAVRRAEADGHAALLQAFAQAISAAWGPARQTRPMRWPIHLRLGRV